MGGRSGSSAPTETTVTQTNLPEYVQPYFERLLTRAEAESNQPYTPYGGERISYFSPDELTAQGMARGYAQAGTPYEFQLASARAAALGSPYQSGFFAQDVESSYDPTDIRSKYRAGDVGDRYTPLGFEENLQRFIDPYQQNVTDIQKREAIRQSEMMGDKTADAAARSGGLGGYREAIMQAERERNLGQQLDDIQARGSQAGYQSALQQLERERAAAFGAEQFGLQQFTASERARQSEEAFRQRAAFESEKAKQTAAKLGLNAEQIELAGRQAEEKFAQNAYAMSQRYGLASAEALSGIGKTIQDDVQERIAALQGIGAQQRAMQQASLDMGYQDFLRQQGFTKEQLGFLGNILFGTPVRPEQQISTYQQQPGLFQTGVGLGLQGLGLYKGLA
tara:strand:- start:167 stop:1348 length:1182 start_codon:yes stop_codon:yes gene_type:complete